MKKPFLYFIITAVAAFSLGLCLNLFFPSLFAPASDNLRQHIAGAWHSAGEAGSFLAGKLFQTSGRETDAVMTPGGSGDSKRLFRPGMPMSFPHDDQGGIEARFVKQGEKILRFADAATLKAFLRKAMQAGLPVLGFSETLLMARIGESGSSQWDPLLDEFPPKGEEFNYILFTPDVPHETVSSVGDAYEPFMNRAAQWLGLDPDTWKGGESVLIAILDTGILPHKSLDESRITRIDLLGTPLVEDGPFSAHGTAIASIIGGFDEYLKGITDSANILGIRVLDEYGWGDSATVALGIIAAVDGGAKIINLSLGGPADSKILYDAIQYAIDHGIAVIASAGNEGASNITYPARYPRVIAVGAIDSKEQRPDFSNQGPALDIVAPGYGNLAAGVDDRYIIFSGTSAAAPYVAGTIGLILSGQPNLSPSDAADIVLKNANDTGAPGHDPAYGNGILDIGRALTANELGITDLAVGGFYLPQPLLSEKGGSVPVTVTVQNRGTENTEKSIVTITVSGKSEDHQIPALAPNESAGILFFIDQASLADQKRVPVDAVISMPVGQDSNPQNDVRQMDFQIRDPAGGK